MACAVAADCRRISALGNRATERGAGERRSWLCQKLTGQRPLKLNRGDPASESAARWRKHAATLVREPGASPSKHADPQPQAGMAGAAPQSEPVVDLTDLPAIKAIGADSDITRFLSHGVPATLVRAALRQAWSADPAIRDFIGPSENAWDFTAPAGVPGFGSLAAEDAQRLLALLQLDPETGSDETAAPISLGQTPEARPVLESGTSAPLEGCPDSHPGNSRTNAAIAATRRESGKQQPSSHPKPQRHGGALPE